MSPLLYLYYFLEILFFFNLVLAVLGHVVAHRFFVAMSRISLVAESRGHSLAGVPLLWSTVSRTWAQ